MRAVVVYPGQRRAPELAEIPPPRLTAGAVRVRTIRVGVCGTDREILADGHGSPPAGRESLVLGHESFGQVVEVDGAPEGVAVGDFVVATVRRGCDHCHHCRSGMSDFCDTGGFLERGILGMDGFMAEQYVESPDYLVRVPTPLNAVGVLLEPLSVVEKALQQAFASQSRVPGRAVADLDPWRSAPSSWRVDRALVIGSGPIGVLTAMRLRLLGVAEVDVVERRRRPRKSGIVEAIGARYLPTDGAPLRDALSDRRYDLIVEAAGSARAVADGLTLLAANGVLVMTGIFPGGHPEESLPLNDLFREMVYRNQALVTSVNSNRSHFERGVETMAAVEERWPGWLERLITRRMPLERYAEAVEPESDGVKTVVEIA